MVVSEDSMLVGFDADAALAAARSVDGASVRLCVEYTPDEFHTLYADETTMALYAGDEDEMRDHFEEVHGYVHMDFTERDLFADLFRGAGEVRSFVTYMDHVTLVRVLVGQQGLLLTADPDTDVTELVGAVEAELD
ncbi:hypothetical protein M0R88_00460 [Halorussus gelatinilyticus]|uniref:Uncharacterized protein n=1 Tax=Halorussus gelatinilyticus TaxID=2937524 RepID=A0A8U0IHM1_9EURY|nr:hypothetical protein [Halorussus gelatinilyticus]UPW00590.1 hypothetical protein M0R88_00460 [Halorussus gelatinilyticus]